MGIASKLVEWILGDEEGKGSVRGRGLEIGVLEDRAIEPAGIGEGSAFHPTPSDRARMNAGPMEGLSVKSKHLSDSSHTSYYRFA